MSNYKPYSNAGQGQGYMQDSFSNDSNGVKKINNHTLRPVTIKQLAALKEVQSDDFKIDGQDLGQITFIAIVRAVNRQSTHNTFTVEDGTGTIEVKKFPMDDEDTSDISSIDVGSYVRVIGNLKPYNQNISVNANSIRHIHDMNEVTYHNLEVIHVHVSTTRSKNGGMGLSSSHNNFSGGIGHTGAPGASGNNLTQQILNMVRSHPAAQTTGVPRNIIISFIAPHCGGQGAAQNLIENLAIEGYLYSGQDDDHLMALDD